MHLFPFRLRLSLRAITHLRSNYPSAGASGKRGRRLPPARSPFWPALIGGSLILLTFVVLSEQSGGAVTYSASFTATEDTYVKSTRPNTNYGHDTTLQADMAPSIKPALVVQWSVPTTAPSPTPGPTSGPAPVGGAIGTTYYVDDVAGNDSNSGTSESTAWRTLGKVSNVTLAPGDRVLFKRGGVWAGPLTLSKAGTADRPITIGSYGSGALPVIQGPGNCVDVQGTRLVVSQLNVKDCAWAGVRISAGATFNRIDGNLITGNVAGVHVDSGASDNVIVGNTLQNNNRMSVNTPGGNDDNGAFGVLLNGDRNEVINNSISGSD